MTSSGWKRLMRFIPKGERIVYIGEPLLDGDHRQWYINRNPVGLKARVIAYSDADLGLIRHTDIVKDVDTIMSPLHSSPIILSAVGNYHSNYRETGIGYTEVPRIGYRTVRMYGGPGSCIIVPTGPMSSFMSASCELGVVVRSTTFRKSPEECMDFIFGFTSVLNITLRENKPYFSNPGVPGIRHFKSYTVIGPWIVNPSEIENHGSLDVCLSYKDRILQHGNTSDMLRKSTELMSAISRGISMNHGTLILTGAPEANKFGKMEKFIEITDGGIIVGSVEKIGFVDTTLRTVTSSELGSYFNKLGTEDSI